MSERAGFLKALVTHNRQPFDLTNVAATYGNGHVAVQGVTCQLDHGTATSLVGANGSGKTTLLRLLAGLAQPSEGTIEPRPSEKSVALVPQQHGLRTWMPLRVSDVLRMSRFRDRGLIRRFGPADRIIIEDAAERMEVADLVNRQFGELSGGQRQRVMVAQALAHDADVLLMDEPITGLDMPSQESIIRTIDDERRRGRIVVISTHHMDEAELCDQVLLLANQMIAVGTPGEVLTNKNLQAAFGLRMAHGDEEDCVFHGEHDSHEGGVAHVFNDHGHGHDHFDC
ncbi:MAG: metal ABC transporter ATP-binding protein [Acidimicrobiia bacterium]|nr:metal ABC transporter ATP-binding protein [Acidimicrobiia bacterium]MXZ77580.1 metal ABC transporter ATP-binding protein [Acidimicrobiia bacterium]MYB09704.1 metal ABC transporter ATP-binding protein [Acidimicrobiia bacterium]MYB75475.1 metal ABC transporter ATP-binding protein [Acidimicrobiia bacterium]MYE74418.1 metal ABC transporter ATP-binding protein [Acidimicrobiia bacterium]